MKAIEVEKLSKVFRQTKGNWFKRTVKDTVAVDAISFQVEPGEAVAFIGPNGAGKSSTIKMLTGILRASSGSAKVLGVVPWERRSQLAHSLGVVFGQRSQLWYHLPPSDTFELLKHIYNLKQGDYERRRDMLIERFGLGRFLNTQVRKLSLGERMRAEIAASLLHAPKMLFLDEPTIGLDVVARQELRDLIREWNRDEGLTVFLTSHDAGDIESVARRVIVINHGQIVLDDDVATMRRDYLGAKVLSVKFNDVPRAIDLPGVTIMEASGHELKLEVDTKSTSIETVISAVLHAGQVADITIEDPPLEEVIAHIYGQGPAAKADALVTAKGVS